MLNIGFPTHVSGDKDHRTHLLQRRLSAFRIRFNSEAWALASRSPTTVLLINTHLYIKTRVKCKVQPYYEFYFSMELATS
jgi:hypothetical protein